MSFPNQVMASYGHEKTVSTTQNHGLGTRLALQDGRVYYYARSTGGIGAGELVESNLTISADALDATVNTAAASGALSVTLGSLSTGDTTAAFGADFYKDGYLVINDGPGQGHVYKISGHAAIGTGKIGTFNLYDDDKIQEALTTANSIGGVFQNEYQLVNQMAAAAITSRVQNVVGVAPTEVADEQYFWCQTWGRAQVLVTGTVAIGLAVGVSTVAGAAGPTISSGAVSTGPTTMSSGVPTPTQAIGIADTPISTATDSTPVFLTIRP